ncbi:MAG: nucleoside triphosphate pyrophosphohydrolase [Oscillospiraceae bacterium]|jgi:tetrapyrrole methylase family protein/MazG family protein|nr:nucleoside triphosphate pyrophosphohydrolase [Oscillospiraceae bacterium]
MAHITIVPLGDSLAEMTVGAAETLASGIQVLLRTSRHPAAKWLRERNVPFRALDALYEQAEDFDTLRENMARAVLEAAPCVYAAPDPTTDGCSKRLRELTDEITVMPGVSQASKALAASGVNTYTVITAAASEVSGTRLDPTRSLVITEIGSALRAGEVKVKLLTLYPENLKVTLGRGSLVERIQLAELDRAGTFDHTSWLVVPPAPLMERSRFDFQDLVDIMERLRDPDTGCPWDREQDHSTLREYILEEACEVIEAIDQNDSNKMADELGDVMLQTVFHAKVDQERGGFDILDVTSAVCGKMIRRHPHIFGAVKADTSAQVLRNWEAIKREEKRLDTQTAVMRDVPKQLPALMRAAKIFKKARDVGFDSNTPLEWMDKVTEEAGELRAELERAGINLKPSQLLRIEEETGDLLFAVVNAARLAGVQPELALNGAIEKFILRFERVEQAAAADGKEIRGLPLAELDRYWDIAKSGEAKR